MKIIVQKTNFYLDKDFFDEVIGNPIVDGVSLNIVYNTEKKLLVYSYASMGSYTIQQFQSIPIDYLKESNILYLETALEEIKKKNPKLKIYLNLIPVNINVIDEESLKVINQMNQEYVSSLEKVLSDNPNLSISLHSISRSLLKLMQGKQLPSDIGAVIYAGDLTPIDVEYYVFPTYMIDDTIFEELIKDKKEIIIYVSDENDLAVITEKYNSPKSTAAAQQMLPKLTFMVNHPLLIEKIFSNKKKTT